MHINTVQHNLRMCSCLKFLNSNPACYPQWRRPFVNNNFAFLPVFNWHGFRNGRLILFNLKSKITFAPRTHIKVSCLFQVFKPVDFFSAFWRSALGSRVISWTVEPRLSIPWAMELNLNHTQSCCQLQILIYIKPYEFWTCGGVFIKL